MDRGIVILGFQNPLLFLKGSGAESPFFGQLRWFFCRRLCRDGNALFGFNILFFFQFQLGIKIFNFHFFLLYFLTIEIFDTYNLRHCIAIPRGNGEKVVFRISLRYHDKALGLLQAVAVDIQ